MHPFARLSVLIFLAVAAVGRAPVWSSPVRGDSIFVDGNAETGLDFVHWNAMTGQYYFPEMTGQGGAFFDYDNDGDLDLYLVQGSMLDPDKSAKALFPRAGDGVARDRLLRNDLTVRGGRTVPRFVDVTDRSGLGATGYGMGVATGDVDNDGDVDLYVTNFGSNQLWLNDGPGADGQVTFTDVTASAGVDDPAWSTSAAFFDYDGDGWLDLFVTNYVVWKVAENPTCYADSSRRDYCGPSSFEPLPDRLFRNTGKSGKAVVFEDVSTSAGIASGAGAGLGVVAADFDNNGRLDIFVANDGQNNFLWVQQGAGAEPTFFDDGLLAGVAVNRQGRPEASMGVDVGDVDGDGDDDLFMTHLMGETNTLYINDGSGLFEDRTVESGLGSGSLASTAFGTGFFDYDNDGRLDLVAMNGAVRILEPLARAGDLYPLDQHNQLFHNVGGGRFEEVTDRAGSAFGLAEVSRGAAFGDVDNDGDVDVLQFNNNGPVRLLLNRAGDGTPWIGVRTDGRGQVRDLLGARVAVERSGAPALERRVATDGSYCSANDPRALVGLAGSPPIQALRVSWPDGTSSIVRQPVSGRYLTVAQRGGR